MAEKTPNQQLVIREAFQGLPVGGMLFHPQQIIYCPPSAVVDVYKRQGDDFLRERDLPQLAREVGARRAVDAVLAVDADGADGVGAQEMAL